MLVAPAFAGETALPPCASVPDALSRQQMIDDVAAWKNGELADLGAERERFAASLDRIAARLPKAKEADLPLLRRELHDWKIAALMQKYPNPDPGGALGTDFCAFVNRENEKIDFVRRFQREMARQEHAAQVVRARLAGAAAQAPAAAARPAAASADAGASVRPAALRTAAVPAPVPAAASDQGPIARTLSSISGFIGSVASVPRAWARDAVGYANKVGAAILDSAAGVRKFVLTGLFQSESGFQANAGSWADCVGLGQLSPGVAARYGVKDRTNIEQNARASAAYLNDLEEHFSTAYQEERLKALFAEGALQYDLAVSAASGALDAKQRERLIDQSFARIYPRIPYGIENALAAYNAGPGAIDGYHGWTHLPLPRGGFEDALSLRAVRAAPDVV
jgi:soluble lytic murein transglycosylase-like protein